MTHIWLVHPDAALRQSLKQTLASVWEGPEYQDFAPDTIPSGILASPLLVLSKEKPESIPDDYFLSLNMDRPVRLLHLLRQIESRLQVQSTPHLLPVGDAALDTRSREWLVNDEIISLTEKEVATMVYLWQATHPVTREDLLRDVWEYAADTDTHTIETHIYRLRQKIEKDPANPHYLLTDKAGYQLAARSKA